MIRSIIAAAVAMSLIIGTGAGAAPPCKDPKTHKFIKCPPPAAKTTTAAKTNRCRDAKGRFAKCGTAGAHPA